MSWSKTSRHERGYGNAWSKLRLLVLRRDNGLCQRCLRTNRVSLGTDCHHKVPRSRGGQDSMENLEMLCGTCHQQADAAALGRTVKPRVQIGLDGFRIDG